MNNDRYEKKFAELYKASFDYVRTPESVTTENIELAYCVVYKYGTFCDYCILIKISDDWSLIEFGADEDREQLAQQNFSAMRNLVLRNF